MPVDHQTAVRADLLNAARVLLLACLVALVVMLVSISGTRALQDARTASCWASHSIDSMPALIVHVTCAGR